ncbi:hypothetical protein TRICI_002667 [Trichomonascus ciferrii]|uniref:Uncharacterized protein n=1 Tax=Trichomonascus ciferrii TaxID=44093 RepID=A0A642VBT3_9ASCO|nr:hypothetical protein TRICI_002667 [Trichomonascus ciferrii]
MDEGGTDNVVDSLMGELRDVIRMKLREEIEQPLSTEIREQEEDLRAELKKELQEVFLQKLADKIVCQLNRWISVTDPNKSPDILEEQKQVIIRAFDSCLQDLQDGLRAQIGP